MTGGGGPPRLGLLGVGWIGGLRLEALRASRSARVVAVADPDPAARARARELAPQARLLPDLEALLAEPLDGVVIATPTALHAEQAQRALARGLAVFVQKPLGRSAGECARVVEAARRADRLLAVDWSYRFLAGVDKLRARIAEGALGHVYAGELIFHNAYGPDKDWYYDRSRAGGGCLIDLGSHLVDLALFMLGCADVRVLASRVHVGGEAAGGEPVEDYASALLETEGGTALQLACSWRLALGRDARIEASFHGTRGGARIRNVRGSFFDFVVEHLRGTGAERLASPPDAWGGRALVDFARRLARGERFDPASESCVRVARVLDAVQGAPGAAGMPCAS